MLCVIYKSAKKAQTYLFVKKRDDFSAVPEALMTMFGSPILVMLVNLATKQKLVMADIVNVKEKLNTQQYYLQLPPPIENLLTQHKEQQQRMKNSRVKNNQIQMDDK